ncbi:MAG: 23S rRNA (pseudouridine(1915)-N(3))-methyltransferase RlmH [Clostridia bacterium]|nr:23S rRNA (pseudouridine(1915)-N(3))-methyltransferase RlmH [Clostridia bacterium]
MKINIICIGSIKEKFYTDAINEYLKRLSKFVKVNVIELKEEKLRDDSKAEEERVKTCETEKLIEAINKTKDSYNILLDVIGKQVDSVELSKMIEDKKNSSLDHIEDLNFIIGGSLGYQDELRNRCEYKLSFSKMTFPHQLMRVILLEQIYRAYKIMNNEAYHK